MRNATQELVAHRRRLAGALSLCLAGIACCILAPFGKANAQLTDRLRAVAFTHAPLILAENVNGQGNAEASDQLLPVDFDGDNFAGDNATNIVAGVVSDGRPRVYFSIVETGAPDNGFFFIGYYFYHPRDGGQSFCVTIPPCTPVVSVGHENDLEGVMLVVQKDPYSPYGQLKYALTQAHGAMIPSYDSSFGFNYHNVQAPLGGWIGTINHAPDPPIGPRAIVMVAQRDHGVYMLEDYHHTTWDTETSFILNGMGPYGILQYPTSSASNMLVVIKTGNSFIAYWPVYNESDVSPRLGPGAHFGLAYYGLTHIADNAFWQLRNTPGLMYQGALLDLGHGLSGLSDFTTASGAGESANPPWQWHGGSGEGHFGFYWYDYAADNNEGGYGRHDWPQIPYGAFLTDPRSAFSQYFPWAISNSVTSSTYYSFNPYIGVETPPPPPSLNPVTIAGPSSFNRRCGGAWFATTHGGVAPLAYVWTARGSSYNTGQINEFDYVTPTSGTFPIGVTVTDAAGNTGTASKSVTANTTGPC